MRYDELFTRNYGIFSREEQERVKNAKVTIIGCGGIGGAVATILARSGVSNLTLVDPDTYGSENMNRQITCFTDTIGKSKVEATREAIFKINPEAKVTVHKKSLKLAEIEELVKLADIVVPAADEWALSLMIFRAAKKLNKPAVIGYPTGALGRVCTFMPDGPSPEECFGLPSELSYEELKEVIDAPEHRRMVQYYVTEAAWRREWMDRWVEGELPLPQICTIVWTTACLESLEVLKLITGKWKLVAAPRHWCITPTTACIKKFGLFRRLLSRLTKRERLRRQLTRLTQRKWFLRLLTWRLR